jgi:pyridoxine 5-phosphate synthase
MRAKQQRLYINIDHVATLRQARRGAEPDPVEAAAVCEAAGADGITAHLREDRRHIQDADIERLKQSVRTYFNLEMACVPDMVEARKGVRPQRVPLVPDRLEEVTTEGGLDILTEPSRIQNAIDALTDAGIRVSLFIDPTRAAIEQSKKLGVPAVELHTGTYSHQPGNGPPLEALRDSARRGAALGLAIHGEKADPERIGARDVLLLLDRVAKADAVGGSAGGQSLLDLAHRGSVEARAEPRKQIENLRRRIRLDGVEHACVR